MGNGKQHASKGHDHDSVQRVIAPRNVILVSGIKETTTGELLKMFFENKRRSGGGPVKKLDYQSTKGQATISFHSEEDAQRVLQRGALSLEGAELIITQTEVEKATHEKERNPIPSCATPDMSSAHILEIRGFKPGTTRDNVEMFIENKSGESELQSCDYYTKTGVAVVAFKYDQGATKLMSLRNLELCGAQLSVTRLMDIYAGLDRESCQPRAIHVQGIPKATSVEFLRLFFENRRKSGGGDVEHVDYDDREGIAVITFKDAESARRVVQKEPLIISGAHIQVKLMTPPMSVPVLRGPFEDNLVLVSCLSPMCTGEDLKTFFSAQNIHSEIQSVTFSLKPGVAMLQFTHPPEFDRLRELCLKSHLGTMLSVQRVPQSKAVQVHNIGDVTEEMLTLYFENRRSGGGEVTNVHVCQEDDYVLLEFAEWANVRDILAKDTHKVENRALHVKPYYEGLGLTPPHHDTTIPGGWIPKNAAVTGFCPHVLNFLQTSAVSREMVDTAMAQVSAVVEWGTYSNGSSSIELTCIISNKITNAQTLARTWNKTVSKTFLDVLAKHFTSEQIETLQEAWQPFLERIGYVDELDPSKISVDVSKDTCTVSITGVRKEVERLSAQLEEDHSKVQEQMTRAAKIVTETKSVLKLHQLRMLNATEFRSQQEKKFTDLDVVIHMKSLEVRFSGIPGDITLAKLEMYEILNNMTEMFIEMSTSLISMLHGKDMRKHMEDQFKSRGICAAYNDAGRNKLGVYALSDEHMNTAIEVINATTCETSVEVDVDKMSSPEKWTELIDAQQSQHGGLLTIAVSGNTVDLAGAKSQVEVALEEIQTFMKENIINEQFVPMEHGVARYIHKYMKEWIGEIIQTFQHSAVKITPHLDGPYGYVVAGNTYSLQVAVQKLQNLLDDVKVQQFPVDKPGMQKFLTSEAGQHSLERLERQHEVVIEPVGKCAQKDEVLASDAGASAGGSNSKSCVTLPGGATVEVIQGDLTKFHADAIVNAANGQLDHCGGLAKAIADAGGPAIQRECRDHVRQSGMIEDGGVYVSTSGRLPCKKVIHAVGPMWKGGSRSEENNLYDAIYESMLAAEQCGLSSIALPALSSGVFGYPIEKSTKVILTALKDFLEANKQSCVKKVSLLDPTEHVVRAFHTSIGVVFDSQMVMTSHVGSSLKKVTPDHSSWKNLRRQPPPSPVFSRSPLTPSSKQLFASTQRKRTTTSGKTQLTTAEGITLTLWKSEIAKQQVDAVVNSTNRSLQLDRGAVSKTLLQNGGKIIETECRQNAPNGIRFGEVVVTSGGRLSCRYIVHGACCSWDGGAGQSEQILRQFLTNCFQAAHDKELTSIAIPAIGTGQLSFPRQIVATVMLDELCKFSSRNPQTPLRDVRFVVYQKDELIIKAFEEVISDSEPSLSETDTKRVHVLERAKEVALKTYVWAQVMPWFVLLHVILGYIFVTSSLITCFLVLLTYIFVCVFSQRLRRKIITWWYIVSDVTDEATCQERSMARQHVTFNIFGKSHAAINAAKKAMEQLCDKESTEIILNSEHDQASIEKLTSREITLLRALEDKHDVKITIQNTQDDVNIRIQGRLVDTSQAQAEMVNIFRQVEYYDKTEKLACLYAKQVNWKYANGEGFTSYPQEISGLLESAFQSKKTHFEWKEDNDETYCVTFNTMKETTHSNRTGVQVHREDNGGSIELPSQWSSMDDNEHVKLETLQPTSHEYKKVETTFMSTAQGTVSTVQKIRRVQNPSLYRQYMLRKEELKKRSKQTTANERRLWHGTSANAIMSINNGGFNRSYCGKNATVYGQGVYFAVGSSYSANNTYATPDDNGMKHVYQALVLTGEYTTGDSTYRVPPQNPAIPGFPFDTLVDKASTPGIFVVFLDNQAYPEYLITFS